LDRGEDQFWIVLLLADGRAAERLGFGSYHRIPPRFYLENLNREVLGKMGFSPEGAEYRPYLFVRAPVYRKSVFRAAVIRDEVLVSDIIQVWLDVSSPPTRDPVLEDEISKRALAQIFGEQS
jgi:hypothetical protein